jgi:hypothetical protein
MTHGLVKAYSWLRSSLSGLCKAIVTALLAHPSELVDLLPNQYRVASESQRIAIDNRMTKARPVEDTLIRANRYLSCSAPCAEVVRWRMNR